MVNKQIKTKLHKSMPNYAHVCINVYEYAKKQTKLHKKMQNNLQTEHTKAQKGQRVSACAHLDASSNFHKYAQNM